MLKLNRWDKLLIIFILISSIALYATMEAFVRATTSEKTVAIVTYRDQEVMRIDMSKDASYVVDGTLGEVTIEVKDREIRVEKETSPYHYCSIQGWVKYANIPIVCLPNHIVILIQNTEDAPNGEDSVIQ